MIKVTISTNMKRSSDIVKSTDTLRSTIENANMMTGNDLWQVNSRVISPSDLDKTFEDMGIEDGSFAILSRIVKADNA